MGNHFSTIPNNNPASYSPADRRHISITVTSCQENGDEVSRGLQYTLGTKSTCSFDLTETRIKNRLESVSVLFSETISNTDSAGNFARCAVKIHRARGGGLLRSFDKKNFSGCKTHAKFCSGKTSGSYTIDNFIYSYGCSFREGLLVLEMKKLLNSNIEGYHKVTMAHYFVTNQVGVSTLAKFRWDKGDNIVVETEYPAEHPSSDLRMVLVETCRNSSWMPIACSHCARAIVSKGFFHNRPTPTIIIGCKYVAGNQCIGPINNSGHVEGNDNGSIHINKASHSPPQDTEEIEYA